MTTKHRISSLAVALAAFAMACADPSAPTRALPGGDATLAVSSVTGHPFPIADGAVQLCKTSNVPGDFDFDATGPAGIDVDPDITIIGAGGGTGCVIIYTSTFSRGLGGLSEGITITETTNTNLTNIDIVRYLAPAVAYTAPELVDSHVGSTATIRINNDMARKVTFTNTAPPPSTGCTYTKGWYRNNGSSTVIAVDGRTKAQAQAIFDATPGKPGGVTWQGGNDVLNLYQQLLAALNNLGGNATAGPASVDAAVAAALAGTGGTGLNITTTLSQANVSDLIDKLSAFNEGTVAGWPHCAD